MPRSTTCGRRGRQDIIIEILNSAKNGTLKTKIMNKAGLSYTQLERYLNALKEADLITQQSGIWKTSKKGLYVIEACKICHSLMKEIP